MTEPELSDDGVPLDGAVAFTRGYTEKACPFKGSRKQVWLDNHRHAASMAKLERLNMKHPPKPGEPAPKTYRIITTHSFTVDGIKFDTLPAAELHRTKMIARDNLLESIPTRFGIEEMADKVIWWLTDRKSRHIVMELLSAVDDVPAPEEEL